MKKGGLLEVRVQLGKRFQGSTGVRVSVCTRAFSFSGILRHKVENQELFGETGFGLLSDSQPAGHLLLVAVPLVLTVEYDQSPKSASGPIVCMLLFFNRRQLFVFQERLVHCSLFFSHLNNIRRANSRVLALPVAEFCIYFGQSKPSSFHLYPVFILN